MRDSPVKDIEINSKTTLSELSAQFSGTGGFVASKVSTATTIIQDMLNGSCTKFLSFPADIMATGTRGLIRQFVEADNIDLALDWQGKLGVQNHC